MSRTAEFSVRYWGTRGSFATPLVPAEVTDKIARVLSHLVKQGTLDAAVTRSMSVDQIRELVEREIPFADRSTYGGNTTCIAVDTPDGLIIVDAGSGLAELGADLQRRWHNDPAGDDRKADLLMTHAHMDHTFGVPFVPPLYDSRNSFTVWAPESVTNACDALLPRDMPLNPLLFSASLEMLTGVSEFRLVQAGDAFELGSTRVTTMALTHPGGCLSYRLERNGRSLVLASDHEYAAGADPQLAEFARDADLLYIDAQYTAAEYEGRSGIGDSPPTDHRGWGHSTVESSVATGLAAGVKRLHLGHHDPSRDDCALAQLERAAQDQMRAGLAAAGREASACEVVAAYEGYRVDF